IAGMLLDAGVTDLGENRIPEAERKVQALGDRGVWHMIGHLQRNKVRKAMPLFSMIHSADSIRLLEEMDRQCGSLGLRNEVLLEVNVSGEESKYGLSPEELNATLRSAAAFTHIRLRGLMTMAPYTDDPEETRPVFRGLRKLLEESRTLAGPDFSLLSMGMTNDYEVAIEEGATHIRVGTALFSGL
ncbi:MAG: YggS family pyridoxal phosphate-dependent enzyme, partial [Planctomycetota bacterium]